MGVVEEGHEGLDDVGGEIEVTVCGEQLPEATHSHCTYRLSRGLGYTRTEEHQNIRT